MISCELNAAGEARILLRLPNMWTVCILPAHYGLASCAAWMGHHDQPRPGEMAVATGGQCDGGEIAEFIATIADAQVYAPGDGLDVQDKLVVAS